MLRYASGLLVLLLAATTALSDDTAFRASAEKGRALLLEKAYVPPHFDQATFDRLHEAWPEPLRKQALAADAGTLRDMKFARYGFDPRPDDPTRPLQYVRDAAGHYAMTCLACHQGSIDGKLIPGLPNNRIALQTLADDVYRFRMQEQQPLNKYDFASRVLPMGTTNGTTNAVVFSVGLLRFRDEHLNVRSPKPARLVHHDLDAPAWWHYRKRSSIYIDGLAPKGHRVLMQFMLVPSNGRERVLEVEPDFEHIAAWLESLEAPAYDGPIDAALAARGEAIFAKRCAGCHGTYGEHETYPEKLVPIETVGTDRLRLDALTPAQRRALGESWLTGYDPESVTEDPGGYIAPPLDGIWATAPYLHNGSVPTLWHLLRPEARPAVWRRTSQKLDRGRMGLEIEVLDTVPEGLRTDERREVFDTSKAGKSAQGHTFPATLSEAQKTALLEYLKTL